MKQLTIRISDELFAKIHERAAETGMSVEDYAHKCLANEAFPLMVVPRENRLEELRNLILRLRGGGHEWFRIDRRIAEFLEIPYP